MDQKTSIGLQANILAGLCYVFSPIIPIVAVCMEKDNMWVREHAINCLLLFVINLAIGALSILILPAILFFATAVFWVMGLIYSFGKMDKDIPLISNWSRLILNKWFAK